jgi:SAM-dependent MidA family methyltransferase
VTLRDRIVQEIREHGPIPFSRYMELCLHDPALGFYSRNTERFGKAGDFYTSSDVHAVFGRLLARQFEEMWRVLGSPARIEILELGPGRGLFARDVLDWSEKKFPPFFAAMYYTLAERSRALRERLREVLGRHFAEGKASLLETPNRALSSEVPVIVFANEFFDAQPVEVVSSHGALRLGEKNGCFVETWMPASAAELNFLDHYGVHPEGDERIEVPLLAQQSISEAAASIGRGFLIVIDYGYTREEQLAGRHRGTLMAYRQHSAGTNLYEAPGEQDITAHVNFTALAAAAGQQGMHAQPLITQSQFLLGIGESTQFADAFEQCGLPQERAKVALQLKHLITPAGLGETFHVLIASKGVEPDKLTGLGGLSFGRSRVWPMTSVTYDGAPSPSTRWALQRWR